MPNHICARCHSDLNHSIAFRERCMEAQTVLQEKANAMKLQSTKELDDNSEHEPHSTTLPYHVIRAQNFKQNAAKKNSKGSAVPNENIKHRKIVRVQSRKAAKAQPATEDLERTSETEQEIHSLSADQQSNKKIKRAPTAKTYVCDKCGRCFADSSNLKVHLLRHSGVKHFECQECSAKYFTQHLLNLHIRVRHQGEMPYACKYCGERFFTSTARCRHESVKHTRNSSYVCKLCGKTYLTKSCLNKHGFLHTGERPYRCDLCHVAFPRNTNLKIHFRSKQHQRRTAEVLDNKL
ncbi:hypothetical protein KR222_007138, partial [Zaprionus bogoriensis]